MSMSNQNRPPQSQFVERMVISMISLFCICIYVLRKESSSSSTSAENTVDSLEKPQKTEICDQFCQARDEQLKKHHNGYDLADLDDLLAAAQKQQDTLLQLMKDDYGQEVYDNLWAKKAKNLFLSANETRAYSIKHFKRRLQIKLLKVRMEIIQERHDLQGCHCLQQQQPEQQQPEQQQQQPEKSQRKTRRMQQTIKLSLPTVPQFYEKFVWSTGGHSAAAGHGNLYNESYTAFIQRAAKPMFSALGLHFEARNYAMGGMDSTPHIALCQEAIFGVDADVISWDFGMTDGRAFWKTNFYANRVGMHTRRPTHISLGIEGRQFNQRREAIRTAEDMGVPAMYFNPSIWEEALKAIPDMFGMTQEKMDSYPPFSKNFKCKDQIEKDEPCGHFKYNDNICPDRKFKASWHPGWRVSALIGNLIGVQISEIIIEIIKDWQNNKHDPFELYKTLLSDEDADYKKLYETTFPDEMQGMVSAEMVANGLKANELYRNKAICHTALLPAETRYLGILTESNKTGFHSYDTGIELNSAKEQTPNGTELPLVYDPGTRPKCEVDLNMDFKDYWIVKGKDDWKSITVPNSAEIEAYAKDGFQPAGIVMICLMKCDWGKCPEGELQKAGFADGRLQFEVNGDKIVNMTGYDEWAQCSALRGEKNGHYHKPNEAGKFEVKARIDDNNAKSFARIMSVIVL